MRYEHVEKLKEDIIDAVQEGVLSYGILGEGAEGITLSSWFRSDLPGCKAIWYGDSPLAKAAGLQRAPLAQLADDQPPVIVVAEDSRKEDAIVQALPYLSYLPKILVAGYGHYAFRDPVFENAMADLLVPSIANGYAHTLVHLYQCMSNAARLGLDGVIAEFGVYKGGTTMFLVKLSQLLGCSWPVIGFDTFGGFPPKRSSLDMYDHAGAEFCDFEAVRSYLAPSGVELIAGDIVETASLLGDRPVVLGFVDTDNYSSAVAAITAIRENVVPGGAIVFDHLTGNDRFRYTLGERMAARALYEDKRYFNLHGTGVFLRQQ